MDFQDQRVLLGGIEPGRLHNPRLHARAARGGVPDLLLFREPHPGQHVVVDGGQALGSARPLEIVAHHIGRVGERRADAGRGQRTGQRAQRQHVHAVGDLARRRAPGRGHEPHVARAAVAGGEIQPAAVRSPRQVAGIAVQRAGQLADVAAVEAHHVEPGGAVRHAARVAAGEGDGAPVGRHDGVGPGAGPLGDLADRTGRDVDGVDVRVAIVVIGGRVFQALEDDGLRIGCPVIPHSRLQTIEPRADVPGTRRQLARRAAVRRHDEEVKEPEVHEAAAILAVVHAVDHARRGRPLGVGRGGGHADRPLVLVGDEHRERDRLAVRRPAQLGGCVGHPRDLRGSTGRIHPAHEYLCARGVAVGEIADTGAVGRPPRRRPLDKKARVGAVGVHQPQRRLPLVLEAVHPTARVHDLLAVGGDLRVGDLLPVEVVIHREQGVGRGFLRPAGGRCEEQHRRRERKCHAAC